MTLAIYTTGSVSGCHANPALTLALAAFRGSSWRKVVPYCAAQMVSVLRRGHHVRLVSARHRPATAPRTA